MLEFSPSWDARWCYILVLVCAIASAYGQIYGRLKVLQSKVIYSWSLFSTWLVFSIYLLVPLILFWFLDRSNAINDTSLFAALLVGLAYPAILSGTTSVKPVSGLNGVFDWLNKITDSLVAKTTLKIALQAQLFERAVVDRLESDAAALEKLRNLALRYSESREQFNQDFAAAQQPREKAQIVYDAATGSVEGIRPLTKAIKQWKPKLEIRSPYTKALCWIWCYVGIALVIGVIVIAAIFSNSISKRFYLWRLTKTPVTAQDFHRTRAALWDRMHNQNDADLRQELVNVLGVPGIDGDRADHTLQLILAARGSPSDPSFTRTALLLIGALRFTPVDVRVRIQHALLVMAKEKRPPIEHNPIADWTPIATESLTDLEEKCRAWEQCWTNDTMRAVSPNTNVQNQKIVEPKNVTNDNNAQALR